MLGLTVGSTDVSVDFLLVDDTGLPVTGKVAATLPTIKMSKGTGADITITLSDLAALTSSHSDGGVKERGEGVYRLDLPDTACSTVAVTKIRGEASGMRVICESISTNPVPADAVKVEGTDATDYFATLDDAVLTAIAALNNLSQANIRTAIGLASANLDTQLDAFPTAAEIFAAVLTSQLTESYAADGTAPTLAQAIFLIQQSLHEFSISSTTRTVKKLDGTTTAATFTLDSATTPTSTTRAS